MMSCYALVLYSEVSFGWRGCVLAALGCICLIILFDELARRARRVKKDR
jgi:hypothetical protein